MNIITGSSISKFLRTDRGALLLCMIMAFIFWLFTKMANSYETDVVVEVNYLLPQGKTLMDPPPRQIEARLTGGGWKLMGQALDGGKPRISFQLNNNQTQVISPRMQESVIEKALRNDYTIVSKSLENITLQLDNLDTIKVPLVLNTPFKLAPQHQFSEAPSFSPDSIFVVGPESRISEIESWTTESISQKNLDKDVKLKIPVKAHLNSQISFLPKEVSCDLKIEQFTEKTLKVKVALVNVPDSLYVMPLLKEVNLSFFVGLSDYEKITPDDFRVIADFGEISWKTNNSIPVELVNYPAFLKKVTYSPRQIEFLVSKTL